MYVVAQSAMIAWIPIVLALFAVMPARRAAIVAFVGGMLFLPLTSFRLPLLPDYTKVSAIGVGVLLGGVIFNARRLLAFRPRWFDLPIAIYCICPLFSSLANDLGVWDGLSMALTSVTTCGIPYFLGRVYFADADGLRELGIAFIVGGLVYIPFCLYEIRMSPQLHNMLYGSYTRGFQVRLGGWRPSVFLEHGLQLGLWMSVASLTGLWLWWTGAVKKIAGVPLAYLLVPLLGTTILCRSTGALVLLIVGAGVLLFTSVSKMRIAMLCLLAVVPAYIGLRASNLWDGEQIVRYAARFDADRAQSFETRLTNENRLMAKALERPVFGWGGWGRSRVFDEWGNDISLTDGLWVIDCGKSGLVGLISGFCVLLLPLILVTATITGRTSGRREVAPILVLAVCVALYAIDCLSNAMVNPLYVFAGGAIVSVAVLKTLSLRGAALDSIASASRPRVLERRLFPRIN